MNLSKEKTYPEELIIGFLNQELDAKQQAELEEWLAQDPDHRKYFYELSEIWSTAVIPSAPEGQKEQAYDRFRQRVHKKKQSRRLFLRYSRIAAAVIAGALFMGLGMYIGEESSFRKAGYMTQTIEVPLGSRTRVVLRDGTVAWLNAGSKLTYLPEFLSDKRHLQLEGEGYFEVATDKKRPFIIETNRVDIEVLGTKFSVKDYGEDEEVEVILAEGSVNFIDKNNPASSVVLKPSQLARLNKESGKISLTEVPKILANVWTSGAHFFNEYTLEQIARILEKSFDVVIIFRDEKKKELTFYSDFRSDDTIDEILDILSSSRKFKYTQNADIIEIF